MQGTLGATLGAGADRVLGTLVGAISGNDVALLGRPAVSMEVDATHAVIGQAFATYLADAAAELRAGVALPPAEPLVALVAQLHPGGALAVACGVLVDDLEVLHAASAVFNDVHER